VQRLSSSWHSGASKAWLSRRIANHVPAQPSTISTPPRTATAALDDNNPTLPRWQLLTPEVRQPLFALLTQMIRQNLPARDATAAREVANECR
jgi:hypothetical protein